MRSTVQYRACRAAAQCGNPFTLADFSEKMWRKRAGKTLSGGGNLLASLARQHGLVRRLGRNKFGDLMFALTAKGMEFATADPHEIEVPVELTAPTPPMKLPPSVSQPPERSRQATTRAPPRRPPALPLPQWVKQPTGEWLWWTGTVYLMPNGSLVTAQPVGPRHGQGGWG